MHLPGVAALREAVANQLGWLPRGKAFRQDVLAGLSSSISNVPDGMANGVLVGINPVYGLYANLFGPLVGGIFASTQRMMIATTAAASLATSQALASLPMQEREQGLVILVILIGVFQVVLGLLGLGKLVRFVSYSVMTGFLTGVSALLILNQLPIITGYAAAGDNKIAQMIDLFAHLDQIDLPSLVLAGITLILAIWLPRTKLGTVGRLIAIAVPSLLVMLLQLDSVKIVREVGEIPRGVPMPVLPSVSGVTFELVTGALAVAAIILVQGAGVSQTVPNRDDSRRRISRDFFAQGMANLAAGFFRGLPVGGSLSATALNVIYGAQTRWATIFAGVWMAVIVILFPALVAYVAMPALGALLILAGTNNIKPQEMLSIWHTGWTSWLAGIVTLLATLFLPIQAAVGIGVVLSALLYINESSTDVAVVELVRQPDGKIEERQPPEQLPDHAVTVLDVYGHLFYAGARTLERLLPRPTSAEESVVILRLRGRTSVGATLIEVLTNYASALEEVNGRLYLTGISEGVYQQIKQTGKLRLAGPVRAYAATAVRGESTHQAYEDAQAWLVRRDGEGVPNQEGAENDQA